MKFHPLVFVVYRTCGWIKGWEVGRLGYILSTQGSHLLMGWGGRLWMDPSYVLKINVMEGVWAKREEENWKLKWKGGLSGVGSASGGFVQTKRLLVLLLCGSTPEKYSWENTVKKGVASGGGSTPEKILLRKGVASGGGVVQGGRGRIPQ